MLLARNHILAVYDDPGQETLRLLGSSVPQADPVADPERSAGDKADKQPPHPPRRKSSATVQQLEAQLQHLADHDPLTGLSNRSHLQTEFEAALKEAADKGSKVGFLLMGLDHFKDLNNVLGHKTGDEILAQLAATVSSLMRANDVIGRMGSDEFGLVLRDLETAEEIEAFADGLLTAASDLILKKTPLISSGASMGAVMYPDHGLAAEELLQNAAIALDQAKTDGRGRLRIFNPQMRISFVDRLEQLSSFRAAIESGLLKPFYQPQMRLSDRRSHGFEALARWVLPSGEIRYPGQFQTALNDPDAAIMLGEHMLRCISADLRRWQDSPMGGCKVSVNVTGPELKRGDYARKVASIFAESGASLSYLTVEITESILIDDKSSQVAQALADLRKLGIAVALDDFGTGFSSLTHLKSYAVDQLKIDRSFVSELPFNAGDRAIVRATLNLARNLRIETVAEGVENEMQAKYLQSLGCDYGQGYFFSRAVPANDAEAFYNKYRAYRKAKLFQFVVPPQKLPF